MEVPVDWASWTLGRVHGVSGISLIHHNLKPRVLEAVR